MICSLYSLLLLIDLLQNPNSHMAVAGDGRRVSSRARTISQIRAGCSTEGRRHRGGRLSQIANAPRLELVINSAVNVGVQGSASTQRRGRSANSRQIIGGSSHQQEDRCKRFDVGSVQWPTTRLLVMVLAADHGCNVILTVPLRTTLKLVGSRMDYCACAASRWSRHLGECAEIGTFRTATHRRLT